MRTHPQVGYDLLRNQPRFADAYDSMTRPHTQRRAMPPRLAAEEIARCSGTQFDPQCAEALGSVLAIALETEANAAL